MIGLVKVDSMKKSMFFLLFIFIFFSCTIHAQQDFEKLCLNLYKFELNPDKNLLDKLYTSYKSTKYYYTLKFIKEYFEHGKIKKNRVNHKISEFQAQYFTYTVFKNLSIYFRSKGYTIAANRYNYLSTLSYPWTDADNKAVFEFYNKFSHPGYIQLALFLKKYVNKNIFEFLFNDPALCVFHAKSVLAGKNLTEFEFYILKSIVFLYLTDFEKAKSNLNNIPKNTADLLYNMIKYDIAFLNKDYNSALFAINTILKKQTWAPYHILCKIQILVKLNKIEKAKLFLKIAKYFEKNAKNILLIKSWLNQFEQFFKTKSLENINCQFIPEFSTLTYFYRTIPDKKVLTEVYSKIKNFEKEFFISLNKNYFNPLLAIYSTRHLIRNFIDLTFYTYFYFYKSKLTEPLLQDINEPYNTIDLIFNHFLSIKSVRAALFFSKFVTHNMPIKNSLLIATLFKKYFKYLYLETISPSHPVFAMLFNKSSSISSIDLISKYPRDFFIFKAIQLLKNMKLNSVLTLKFPQNNVIKQILFHDASFLKGDFKKSFEYAKSLFKKFPTSSLFYYHYLIASQITGSNIKNLPDLYFADRFFSASKKALYENLKSNSITFTFKNLNFILNNKPELIKFYEFLIPPIYYNKNFKKLYKNIFSNLNLFKLPSNLSSSAKAVLFRLFAAYNKKINKGLFDLINAETLYRLTKSENKFLIIPLYTSHKKEIKNLKHLFSKIIKTTPEFDKNLLLKAIALSSYDDIITILSLNKKTGFYKNLFKIFKDNELMFMFAKDIPFKLMKLAYTFRFKKPDLAHKICKFLSPLSVSPLIETYIKFDLSLYLNEFKKAEKIAETFRAKYPLSPHAYLLLTIAYLYNNKLEEALYSLNSFIELLKFSCTSKPVFNLYKIHINSEQIKATKILESYLTYSYFTNKNFNFKNLVMNIDFIKNKLQAIKLLNSKLYANLIHCIPDFSANIQSNRTNYNDFIFYYNSDKILSDYIADTGLLFPESIQASIYTLINRIKLQLTSETKYLEKRLYQQLNYCSKNSPEHVNILTGLVALKKANLDTIDKILNFLKNFSSKIYPEVLFNVMLSYKYNSPDFKFLCETLLKKFPSCFKLIYLYLYSESKNIISLLKKYRINDLIYSKIRKKLIHSITEKKFVSFFNKNDTFKKLCLKEALFVKSLPDYIISSIGKYNKSFLNLRDICFSGKPFKNLPALCKLANSPLNFHANILNIFLLIYKNKIKNATMEFNSILTRLDKKTIKSLHPFECFLILSAGLSLIPYPEFEPIEKQFKLFTRTLPETLNYLIELNLSKLYSALRTFNTINVTYLKTILLYLSQIRTSQLRAIEREIVFPVIKLGVSLKLAKIYIKNKNFQQVRQILDNILVEFPQSEAARLLWKKLINSKF